MSVGNLQPLDIVIIDDSEDDIFLVQETFKHLRLLNLVKAIPDAEEALQWLRGQWRAEAGTRPSLILLDINMPGMDGFEFLTEIKADSELRHIPVAILTTSDSDDDRVHSYTSGACSYIRKPVSFDGLLKIMKEFELYWTFVSQVPPKFITS